MGQEWFATTHWSVVITAQDRRSQDSMEALETLCRVYWPPLFTYIRRQGYELAEAQDLTQEFFARLLERDYLAHLRHPRGKFRSFLLTFLKHFLSEQRGKARAQKRGGGKVIIPLDTLAPESGGVEPCADGLTPDQAFERRWAETVMERALDRLRLEYDTPDRRVLFERLQHYQPREPGALTYTQLGADLGLTEAAVKSAVQRMRLRHRELLRDEIAQTVARSEDLEEEIRHLRVVLSWTKS